MTEIAEQETARLSERIKSGLREAKSKGKVFGRPKGSTVDIHHTIENNAQYKSAAWLLKKDVSLRTTAALAGIAINTVRKIKKAMEEQNMLFF